MSCPRHLGFLASVALFAACGFDPAVGAGSMGLSAESLELLEHAPDPEGAEDALQTILESHFGSVLAPRFPQHFQMGDAAGTLELKSAGRLYRSQCMHCHGVEGGGDGSSAYFLTPPPTDFRLGKFKWTALERDHPPRLEDIERTLEHGVPFTSMPSFLRLEETQRKGLAQIVRWLAARGQTERWLVAEWVQGGETELAESVIDMALSDVSKAWNEAAQHVLSPVSEPRPEEMVAERIERGRQLYFSDATLCSSCHGPELEGDGPAVFQKVTDSDGNSHNERVRDEWGAPSQPRDLRQGGFRGGSEPLDLYRRIRAGISGTIMPAAHESMSEEAVWDLVYFVLSEAGLHGTGDDAR